MAKSNGSAYILRTAKFVDERGVKHHICTFLKWENILFFSSAQESHMAMVSFAEVPRVRASRTIRRISLPSVVGRQFMFINIQLRQRTDINLKLALDRQGIGQLIVQAMDSLDD